MAITFTLTKQTPNALAYLLTQDGGAGTVVTIDNASMVADLIITQILPPFCKFMAAKDFRVILVESAKPISTRISIIDGP